MRKFYGICPTCLKRKILTQHHIFPQRRYGNRKNDTIILLCQDCHIEIEKLIPEVPTEEQCITALYWMLVSKVSPVSDIIQ